MTNKDIEKLLEEIKKSMEKLFKNTTIGSVKIEQPTIKECYSKFMTRSNFNYNPAWTGTIYYNKLDIDADYSDIIVPRPLFSSSAGITFVTRVLK